VRVAASARGDSTLVRQLRTLLFFALSARGRVPPFGPQARPEQSQENAELARREFGLGPESLLAFEGDSAQRIILPPAEVGPDGRPNEIGAASIARYRLFYGMLGFHDRRTLLLADTAPRLLWWVAARPGQPVRRDSLDRPPLQLLQVRLASGNTTAARELLREWDYQLYLGEPGTPMLTDDHLWVAESYLELGDSATALARLRDYAAKLPRGQLMRLPGSAVNTPPMALPAFYFLPRFWLRYGDLAYAMHQRDEAIRAYRFIEGLWADADPVFQPTVQRVRTRLAELTGRAN